MMMKGIILTLEVIQQKEGKMSNEYFVLVKEKTGKWEMLTGFMDLKTAEGIYKYEAAAMYEEVKLCLVEI